MKRILIFIFVFSHLLNYSQNGPGGVGTSANNVLWLDANRGVTVSGTSVTAWADQSGNGFSAVPSAVIARPAFVSNSANGYPTIDFDGSNDEFWINDNAAFDLTQWHFFIVPLVDTQKNYNAWLTKGNDSGENYEILSFNDGNVHTPTFYTDASRTAPSSAGSQVTATANIIEYSYSSSVGRDVYKNIANISTDNENKTPSTNNFSLYIGNERNTTGRFINGDLAEVIMYNAPLNSAQRIIVNNYLAAKYNCTLTANDLYTMDNAANGNFDHDVAGIGRVNSSNVHNDSRGSGIVRILNPSGLGDNEFYFWGHDNGALGSYITSDFPSSQGVQGRLVRVWRGSETGTITDFEIRFDLTGLGSVTASQLRLLIDTDNDGTFADETTAGGGVIGSAVSLGSNVYGFTNITGLNNNIRFTLGTTSLSSTPLPMELTHFSSSAFNDYVKINWTTASEKNCQSFEIEKSKDAIHFEKLTALKCTNLKSIMHYQTIDTLPYDGINYYRLKQIDDDGSVNFSETIYFSFENKNDNLAYIIPNPNDGDFNILLPENNSLVLSFDVINLDGKNVYSAHIYNTEKMKHLNLNLKSILNPGIYILLLHSENETKHIKLIVK